MAHYIVDQPNGRYAVYSTLSHQILIWDATKEEIEEWLAQDAAASIRLQARREFAHHLEGDFSRWWGPSWDEAVERDLKSGGEYSQSKTSQKLSLRVTEPLTVPVEG